MTDFELFLQYNYYKNLSSNQFLDKRLFEQNEPQWLILLHATYKCNSNCSYCENHLLKEKYNNKIMSEKILRQIIQKLGPNTREFTWHGGESLLLPKKYFQIIQEEKEKNNLNFSVSLQTNGILLTKEKEQLLKKYNITIGTSFDGISNTIHRGQASTNAILNFINNNNYFYDFISVYTKDNINTLINNYNYYKKLKIKKFQSCIVRENVGEGNNNYLIDNDIAVQKVLEYIDFWIHDINNPIFDSYINRQINRIFGRAHLCEDINCIGGWLIVDPLGNITTCGMIGKENNFCNIQDINNYQDLLINQKFRDTFYKQISLIEKECYNCEWEKVCYGGCMGLNYEKNSNYTKLNQRYCEYNKKLLKGIYELIKDIDINDKQYNPIFIKILKENNFLNLTEIKKLEERFNSFFDKRLKINEYGK